MKKIIVITTLLSIGAMLTAQVYDYDDIYFDPAVDIIVKTKQANNLQSQDITTTDSAANSIIFTADSESYTDRIKRFNLGTDDSLHIEGLSPFIGDSDYVNIFLFGEADYNVSVDGNKLMIESIDDQSGYESQMMSNNSWQYPYSDIDAWGSPYRGYRFSYWDSYFYDPFYSRYYSYHRPYYWGYYPYHHHHCHHHHYCYGHVPKHWWRKDYYHHGGHNSNHFYSSNKKRSENIRRSANTGLKYNSQTVSPVRRNNVVDQTSKKNNLLTRNSRITSSTNTSLRTNPTPKRTQILPARPIRNQSTSIQNSHSSSVNDNVRNKSVSGVNTNTSTRRSTYNKTTNSPYNSRKSSVRSTRRTTTSHTTYKPSRSTHSSTSRSSSTLRSSGSSVRSSGSSYSTSTRRR